MIAEVVREEARERARFSEEAWQIMQDQLQLLSCAPPAAFGIGRDGTVDDEDKKAERGLRGFARMYAAIFCQGETVEELAAEMAGYSSQLTFKHWVEILGGKAGWPELADLRAAHRLLRDGYTDREAMELSGVSHRQVKLLAATARVDRWQKEQLMMMAWDAHDEGWTGDELCDRWNGQCPERMRIGRSRAYQVLARVRRLAEGEVA